MLKRKLNTLNDKKPFPWIRLGMTLLAILIFLVIYMDAWLMHRFDGMKWQLPAAVFARPLEIYEGKAVTSSAIISELEGLGYTRENETQSGSFWQSDDQLYIHTRPFRFWDMKQPALSVKLSFNHGRITEIEGLDKAMNGSFRLEPIKIGSIHPQQHEDRLLVSIDEVPETLVQALLATEDRDFFNHHGISIRGIARAAWSNIRHGGVVQGASTLTQQLVKNFFLTSSRTFFRKIEEIIMALLLELRASKKEILDAYINEVFVAQDGSRSIHGFGLASEFFFATPLKQLSVSQVALLVGMMKGPSYYNPVRHPERAMERRNLVLRLMNEQGYLTADALAMATAQPLDLTVKPDTSLPKSYAAYLQLVRQQLSRDYSKHDLQTQGLRVFTNLDPGWQTHAQDVLNKGILSLQARYGKSMDHANGAIVVVNHATGDVEALVGGKAFRPGSFNRALYANRPIGSLVKPAVYLTAFEGGRRLTDLISDEPLELTVNKKIWQPQNYDHKTHYLHDLFKDIPPDSKLGIPLYLAMAKSYNIATVRLGMDLGVDKVASTLAKLGVESDVPKVPSLFLGSISLTPIEVAQMYATLGGAGFYAPLNTIREVTNSKGKALKRYKIKLEKRFDTDTMYLINFVMEAVIKEGTGSSVASRFVSNNVIAGKSGTTNDLRDNWFAGYDSDKTAVVWLGNDDNKPLPMYASASSLPIWANLMTFDKESSGVRPIPDNIEYHWIDAASNKLTKEGCPDAVYIPFIKGTAPQDYSDCYINKPKEYWFKRWFQ